MSKVEELLAKYNSKGISTIKLADILDYEQPSKYIVSSSEYDDNYDIPVLTAGQSFILGYTDEKDGVYKASKNNPTIIFDDFTTGHHWVDFDFKIKSSAMKMLRLKNDKSLLRYIFHSMALINYVPTEHSRQWISKYSQFEIPLPHIKVQEEIVKILDSFTNLIDALNEELSLRQKQFEYYREKLLTFDDNVYTMSLGDCCVIKGRIGFRGYTIKDQVNKGEGAISLSPGNISEGIINYNQCTYISWDKYYESPEIMINNGDIIFCKTASVGKVAVINDLPCEATINPQLVVLKEININKKYLYYYLSSNSIQNKVKSLAGVGSVPNISQSILNDLDISVPSSQVMKSIVEKLDAFESLISSLKEEIALRQKQYEYYREKLLTFD